MGRMQKYPYGSSGVSLHLLRGQWVWFTGEGTVGVVCRGGDSGCGVQGKVEWSESAVCMYNVYI